MWATRPQFWFRGGTPPTTPRQVAPPPGPPVLPTPVGLGFARVLGPTRGGVANVGNSPLILVLWGDTPHNPRQGAYAPWTPFTTPIGLGFARVLGPTRGGFANVGYSPPILVSWGDTPYNPPPRGLRPLDPPFCPPPWAKGLPAFRVPLVAGLQEQAACP
jgi:hypothetical protein